jgi:hypothetical protein
VPRADDAYSSPAHPAEDLCASFSRTQFLRVDGFKATAFKVQSADAGARTAQFVMSRALFLIAAAMYCGSAVAQTADPQAILNRLLRDQTTRYQRQQIEEQQRFEDQQRQRALDLQEAAYDREMCLKVCS